MSQMFFNTNSSSPDSLDDITEIQKIHQYYGPHLASGLTLTFLGWADHRPTTYTGGNEALARDRAENTCTMLIQSWQVLGYDITKLKHPAYPCGVDPDSYGQPATDEALAGYRRVDIIASPVHHPAPPPAPPGAKMSNDWEIEVQNITTVSVGLPISFGLMSGVKEVFNAVIRDLKHNDELWFKFSGVGLSVGPPGLPGGASYSQKATGGFTTVYNHTLNEFAGRIAHACFSVHSTPPIGKDWLFMHVKGGSRREDITVEIKGSGISIGLPGGTTVSGDLMIVGPAPVP